MTDKRYFTQASSGYLSFIFSYDLSASANFSWVNRASASRTNFLSSRLAVRVAEVVGSAGSNCGNTA